MHYFIVPFRSLNSSQRPELLLTLLRRTLLNLACQTGGDFHIVLVCTEAPDIDYVPAAKLSIVEANLPIPTGITERRRDADTKVAIGAEHAFRLARNEGDFSLMKVDADDLLAKDLLERTGGMDIEHGFIINRGYLHRPNSPILWKHFRFHQICGSCASIMMRRRGEDIFASPGFYADLFLKSYHPQIPAMLQRAGRPLAMLPFWAAVYTLNYGENTSGNTVKRKWRPWRMQILARPIRDRFPGVADRFERSRGDPPTAEKTGRSAALFDADRRG